MSEAPSRAGKVLLVSATDSRFFAMMRGMLETLRPAIEAHSAQIACFDIGMTEAQSAELRDRGIQVAQPGVHLGVAEGQHPTPMLSFLARPFLPEIFPGYDVYVWVDSDIWFQDPLVLSRYIDGATQTGFAITHEREHGYRLQPWLFGWTAKHFLLGYGPAIAAWLLTKRHLNAGFFAGRADAPHWGAWAQRYRAAIERTGSLVPHDQFSLVQALHLGGRRGETLSTCFLDPTCNWIVDRGVPMWNDALGAFCHPYAPYVPIAALHLAGPGKRTTYDVSRTGGGSFRTRILPGAAPHNEIADAVTRANVGHGPLAASV